MEYLREMKEFPSLVKEIVGKFHEKTPKRLKLIDFFIIFLAALTVFQLVYYTFIGRHPFEALLAGVYTTLGTMIFTGK
jgi:oligosaccharyltransferase complex subunit epsilon